MKFPFTPSPQYTAIALAYQNKALIAEQVMPRMGVTAREFKYDVFTKDEGFTLEDTRVGRKGVPNEVEFTSEERTGSVDDQGLQFVVPNEDIEAAAGKPALDPVGRHVEGIANKILLGREKRVADIVFGAGNFAVGNKVTLSGTDQWSDFTNSDPVEDILAAKEGMLVDTNTLVIGSQVAYVLRRHPKVVAAAMPMGSNAVTGGIVALNALRDLFEVANLYVGGARYNTSKQGQTAAFGRIWGKHAALLAVNPMAGIRGTEVTFGVTAEYLTRIASTRPDGDVGLRGGVRGKVGESVKELVICNDAGYLFTNAVA
jgi:hypothetical protein